eukprot:CAMPEP_0204198470 /NCGR_PEP_ID=MMETSP0361-20130328/65303_1 /ASSEMBLY_ACC=CAM_ASM_000343 /TAXON_ID=268821 /ORGANISM="Scrippsiella Hangoei, Strain SHTV-5" /LENGTH=175 /DNA_ID=CAMNT_0051160587 /DNA_START=223 /DNA_END=751 /DNA_ORIENTATION=+
MPSSSALGAPPGQPGIALTRAPAFQERRLCAVSLGVRPDLPKDRNAEGKFASLEAPLLPISAGLGKGKGDVQAYGITFGKVKASCEFPSALPPFLSAANCLFSRVLGDARGPATGSVLGSSRPRAVDEKSFNSPERCHCSLSSVNQGAPTAPEVDAGSSADARGKALLPNLEFGE